jgi:uncharacterized protein (TIGR02996 family)
MPSATAFLADILEHPDDDTPRLVYADWLDENGDPDRAEFIRVQCELARGGPDKGRLKQLAQREMTLLHENRQTWVKEVPAWARRYPDEVGFRRGFIAHVICTALAFLQRGAGLFRRSPVQSIDFSAFDEYVGPLANCPLLGRLTALSLPGFHGDPLGPEGARVLSQSPYLGNLQSLDLASSLIGPEGMAALAGASCLSGLNRLVLYSNELGPEGARALASSAHLTALTALNLGDNHLQDEGVQILANSRNLRGLQELQLYNNHLLDEGARAIASAPWKLTSLDLDYNEMSDKGASRLARSRHLAHLTTLRLANTTLTERGARALAESPHLTRLTHLTLGTNDLRDPGAKVLAQSPHLATLELLSLEGNGIGDEGARALADSPYLHNLVYLNLYHNSLGKATVAHLKARFGEDMVGTSFY